MKFERGPRNVHTLTAPYSLLVERLGDDGLTAPRDEYKSKATWVVGSGDDYAEVYDYRSNLKLPYITEWHVQGTEAGIERMLAILSAPAPRTFTVRVNPKLHIEIPEPGSEKEIVWAYLDTAYAVLREAAARLVLNGFRDTLAQAGQTLAPDEEYLASLGLTYADLAPHSIEAAEALRVTFSRLVDLTVHDAEEGLLANLKYGGGQ